MLKFEIRIGLQMICLVLLILAIAGIANASDYESVIPGYHKEWNKVDGDVMFFNDLIIDKIDAATFQNPESINMDYGHDKDYVYYRGEYTLEGLNPNKYEIGFPEEVGKELNKYIAYDKDTICIRELCTEVEDTDNIVFIEADLFFVNGTVYRIARNEILIVSESAELEFFTPGYNIAEDAVYWYGELIEEADPDSFEIYDWAKWSKDSQFAHDKNNVYLQSHVLYDADVKSFLKHRIHNTSGEIVDSVVLDSDLVFYRDKYVIVEEVVEEYPHEADNIDQALSSAIQSYEEKYPGYTPQLAQPEPGSPEEQELKEFQERVKQAEAAWEEKMEREREDYYKWGSVGVGAFFVFGLAFFIMRRIK